MVSLYKRATPRQHQTLRIVAGAVKNAAHAHHLDLPRSFARSVAKRAVGTLTAQWPNVLALCTDTASLSAAGVISRRHQPHGAEITKRDGRGSSQLLRRSPIRRAWKHYADQMWKIKREGGSEEYATYVRILKLLDQAQQELDGLTHVFNVPGPDDERRS